MLHREQKKVNFFSGNCKLHQRHIRQLRMYYFVPARLVLNRESAAETY